MFSVPFQCFLSHPLPHLCVSVVEEEVNEEAEKEKRRKEYVNTYISPWERAMKDNVELKATMKPNMPGPIQDHPELPQYKSFNRYITQTTIITIF